MSHRDSMSDSNSNLTVENCRTEKRLLSAVNDDYGGVIVQMKESMEPAVFSSALRASLSDWRLQGKKGVWIKLPIKLISLAEIAVKEGFWLHHAEPTHLMLVCWLPTNDHTLPANASHRVSVAAFVMNDKNEVLVVQEKKGRYSGQGIWKFPTGVVNEGEDIYAAAVREVKEETGITTEFLEVLAFRQSHKIFFGKSDLFFVCMLKPFSSDIQAQESEIEAAQWMLWDEYMKQPFTQTHELWRYITEICLVKKNGTYSGFTSLPLVASNQHSFFYLNNQDFQRQTKGQHYT